MICAPSMKVLVAEEAGFCFGVKRALKLIEQIHNRGHQIQTFGPLIHNKTVLDDLRQKGIDYIDNLSQRDPQKILVIRTHGIPRQVEAGLKRRRIAYLDATCPLVKRAQEWIAKLEGEKTQVIIVGDKDHPEIAAARSYARRACIVNSLDDARALPFRRNAGVVAQTTLNTDFFKSIVCELLDRTETLGIYNTICAATRVRQEAIRKLAPLVDVVVVVGDADSSNTRKLADISRQKNPRTFHIESSRELTGRSLLRRMGEFSSVGITAGASTPPEEIQRVRDFFKNLNTLASAKEIKHVRGKRNQKTH
jgi:(E)-4-hydroxy-3-methyl-but-2-enyl pyrophosphate reductase